MKEPGSPAATAMLTGAFICGMASAACLVLIENPTTASFVLFSGLFLASLGLVLGGIVVSWRNRKKRYEFVEPTSPWLRLLLAAFRIVAGFILTVSGFFMLAVCVARVVHGEGFPVMGFLMGLAIGSFGLKGLIAGLKKRPNQALQPTRMLVTDRADARSAPSTRVADL
jgi:hypothetical protein